jgi:hypothetical protein
VGKNNPIIFALFICTFFILSAKTSQATEESSNIVLLKPFTVTADESHDRVIQTKIPNRTSVGIAFSGKDIAVKVEENSTDVNASIENNGRTVIIRTSFREDEKGTVTPVHIMTKEGRTHTIALIPLGKNYKMDAVTVKVVIKSSTE